MTISASEEIVPEEECSSNHGTVDYEKTDQMGRKTPRRNCFLLNLRETLEI